MTQPVQPVRRLPMAEIPSPDIPKDGALMPKLSIYKHEPDPAQVAVALGSTELLMKSFKLPRTSGHAYQTRP